MQKQPTPTWFFVLVVVRLGHRFLLVHERKHGQLWYLPAGRVEPGESLVQAAQRETLEEAGIPIEVDGVLRFEHSPSLEGSTRFRVIFTAHPVDDTPPKTTPDADSLEAAWFTLEEISQLPLRGEEVVNILRQVAYGAAIYPLTILTAEGQPFLNQTMRIKP